MDHDHDDNGGTPAAGPCVRLSLANVRGLTAVLQAIKPGQKQLASVLVEPEGLSLRWEDESKTLQSSVYLRSELFASYDAPREPQAFGLQFSALVDALAAFACACGASGLMLNYPGPDGELQLEMRDAPAGGGQATAAATAALAAAAAGGPPLQMYARLAALEAPAPRDVGDFWTEPASHAIARGGLLKEAIEDLEWPNGPVEIELTRDPRRFIMRASGTNGSLEVEVPQAELLGFSVAAPRVAHRYSYRNLRAALAAVPSAGRGGGGSAGGGAGGGGGGAGDGSGVSTKLSVDASGILRVTHMVALLHGPAAGGAPPHLASLPGGGAPSALTAAATQGALAAGRAGRVQFTVVPMVDDDDDDADGGADGAGAGGGGGSLYGMGGTAGGAGALGLL